ncbi:MAG: hypothetical protein OEM51_06465 [Gammaproteobacteria bacterium]|nr:hypothetical protein [Gammaproteobacteria bacterium]
MDETAAVRVHWSFWLIGAVGLIFNLIGCMNYVSQMNAENVASMPDVYRAIVESRPAWGTGAFAIAVFGGSLGCILLLLRKSVAVYVFILALVAALVAQIPFVGMADFPVAAWIGWLSQLVVGAFLIWYSKQTASKGWID